MSAELRSTKSQLVLAREQLRASPSKLAPNTVELRQLFAHLGRPLSLAGHTKLAVLHRIDDGKVMLAALQVPSTYEEERVLLLSLGVFSLLLLLAGGAVAYVLSRDVHSDLVILRRLIEKMAQDEQVSQNQLVPIRSIDQVGQLTASFNVLLERFHAAERAYRADLTEADAFARDKSAFLSALSHELRTPLNGILGFADILLTEMDGPLSDEARENLTIVRTSGEHLRSLIDDILALSAMEAGEFRLSCEDLDLYQVALSVVAESKVTAQQKGLELRLSAPPVDHSLCAFADRRRMRQVLQNLISNAVKFTQEGEVRVELQALPTSVQVEVSDTGPGISHDALERIFEEFEQAPAAGSERSGTGLGLSITRRLVNLHGGQVRVQSEPGGGSSFVVEIPRKPPRGLDSVQRSSELPAPPRAQSSAPLNSPPGLRPSVKS